MVLRVLDDRRAVGAQVGAAQALLHRLLDGGGRVADRARVERAVSGSPRRDAARRPADPHAHCRRRQAVGAGRVRGRLRGRHQHAGHRALFSRRRGLPPVRGVRTLPRRALHHDRLRRTAGLPRPCRAADEPRPRPSRTPSAARFDAHATAIRSRADRMARLRPRPAGQARRHRPQHDERGAGRGGEPVPVRRAGEQPRRDLVAAGLVPRALRGHLGLRPRRLPPPGHDQRHRPRGHGFHRGTRLSRRFQADRAAGTGDPTSRRAADRFRLARRDSPRLRDHRASSRGTGHRGVRRTERRAQSLPSAAGRGLRRPRNGLRHRFFPEPDHRHRG